VEQDRWRPEPLGSLARRWEVVVEPDLVELAGLLACSKGCFGNDSGLSHLAGAVGARTIALFGPTREEHFRPLGPSVKVVQASRMEQIKVSQVLQAWDAFDPGDV
jgi:ADP-heptose:LPS heptosyltransferase